MTKSQWRSKSPLFVSKTAHFYHLRRMRQSIELWSCTTLVSIKSKLERLRKTNWMSWKSNLIFSQPTSLKSFFLKLNLKIKNFKTIKCLGMSRLKEDQLRIKIDNHSKFHQWPGRFKWEGFLSILRNMFKIILMIHHNRPFLYWLGLKQLSWTSN